MVTVAGLDMPALWIAEPHLLSFDGSNDRSGLRGDTYLSGPVLIWVEDEIQYRLEGVEDRTRALDLAARIDAGTDLLPAE